MVDYKFVLSLILFGVTVSGRSYAAPKDKVLYSFTMHSDGAVPVANVIFDAKGNLYGTASLGAANDDGAVFMLTAPSKNQKEWVESTLLQFPKGKLGYMPVAGLISDNTGDLYGTTQSGGAAGFGTVFKIAPPKAGRKSWTETVLHSFAGSDGAGPTAGLLFDSAGNLYGTTQSGGDGNGTVFRLEPPTAGKSAWTETVLYSFPGGSTGQGPVAPLIFDSLGNLYGTTSYGGSSDNGTVFQLSPSQSGKAPWTITTLHSFAENNDGAVVYGAVAFSNGGNLYGTTVGGGKDGNGTVFQLVPPGAERSAWSESVIYSFTGGNDGTAPFAGVAVDANGNLYGTTNGYGNGDGSVFELSPPQSGKSAWSETTLTAFTGPAGSGPSAGVTLDASGNIYGTTTSGGKKGYGVVFRLPN